MGLPARPLADLLLFWGGVSAGIDPWRIAPVDDARAVQVPTLVLCGGEDARVHPDESRALAEALPRGRLAMVEDFPHAPLADIRPDTWDALVGSFLAEVAPGS